MSSAQSYLFFVKQMDELNDNQKIFTYMLSILSSHLLSKEPMAIEVVFHMATHLKGCLDLSDQLIKSNTHFERIAHESMRFRNQEMQKLIRLFMFICKRSKTQVSSANPMNLSR